MPRRIRRTYLVLSAQHYDGTGWVRTPRLVQRLEHPADQPAYYLRRGYGEAVALVEPTAYPELTICEQR